MDFQPMKHAASAEENKIHAHPPKAAQHVTMKDGTFPRRKATAVVASSPAVARSLTTNPLTTSRPTAPVQLTTKALVLSKQRRVTAWDR